MSRHAGVPSGGALLWRAGLALVLVAGAAVAEERAEGERPERQRPTDFSQAIGQSELRLPTAAEYFAKRPSELWSLAVPAAALADEQTEASGGGSAPTAPSPIFLPLPVPASSQPPPGSASNAGLSVSADLDQSPLEEESLAPSPERAALLRSAMTSAMSRAAAASAASLGSAETIFRSSNELSRFQPLMTGGSSGFSDFATSIGGVRGLRISSAAIFFGASSNAAPQSGFRTLRNFDLGGDYDMGARATISYGKNWRRSSLRADYTPSQVIRGRYPQWNSTNHNASLRFTRQISRRWDGGVSTSASQSGMEQFWLEAPILRQVENPPANLDELFGAVERGEMTDEEFASVLTGAPIVEQPTKRNFDLGRVLSYQGSAQARYIQSPRLSYSFNAGYNGSRLQNDPRGDELGRIGVRRLQNRSVSARADYRLNRTVEVGLQQRASWIDSTLYGSTVQQTSAHWSQRLTRRFSYSVHAGGGVVNGRRTDAEQVMLAGLSPDGTRHSTSYIYGADFNYRHRHHLLSASVDRRLGDSIGLGARNSFIYRGEWQWAPLAADWVFRAGGSRNLLMRGDGEGDVASLDATLWHAGVNRRLAPTTGLSTTYYYGKYDSPLRGIFSNISVHRLQVALLWRPVEGR